MDIKKGLNRVMKKAREVILISTLLAAGVGIGSLLTQYTLKLALDFSLAAQLMAIFFLIMAFGGAIFSLLSRHRAAT